jgi:hypothetical protein
MTRSTRSEKVDPLYVIFEQHLYNFQDSDQDRKTFICNVVGDYLSYLRKSNLAVPRALEQFIVEELYEQVKMMMLKKIYGCATIQDYRQIVPPKKKRAARSKYAKVVGG